MYKNFGSELARLRREREQHGESAQGFADEDKQAVLGMHAARCFLGALSGYQGSGWLAAEEYACAVLPKEVGWVRGGYCAGGKGRVIARNNTKDA